MDSRLTICNQSRVDYVGPINVKARSVPVATSKLDEYRANALECERLAEQTRDAHFKEQFLKTAQQWRDMAALRRKTLALKHRPGRSKKMS